MSNAQPRKPIETAQLAKWELKDEKALALTHSIVSNEVFIHIENCGDAWSTWKTLKNLFDSQLEVKRVDLQLKLLQQKLNEGVLNYELDIICRLFL
jgi:hypothetical protein